MEHRRLSYAKRHPVLLFINRKVVELLIIYIYEHLRVLHAEPTLVSASLTRCFALFMSTEQ